MTLSKKYDHKQVEEGRYTIWKEAGYFKSGDKTKEPYTVVIPPPNITGKLHLGHAWDNTLQDIIIRHKRMQGYDALFLPGMDHAGIATQSVIDKALKSRGIDRLSLGREAFLEEAWRWKETYSGHIHSQWEALGISVDYDRERFTLDEGLSRAVEAVFIRLHERSLIYRKERIINWDIEAKTAISNIEVEHFDIEGALYYFKYVLEDGTDNILIATTRPETMFGDTALMVHPDDETRVKYVGKRVFIPGTDVLIPVIADEAVDRAFGTGAVKVTPAHDPNDFLVGERHSLPMPLCMDETGKMNERAFQYKGLDRFECRRRVVEDTQKSGLLVNIEKMIHSVGHSERSGAIVEPRLSMQWFVKMEPLAQRALAESDAHFIPPRFEKIFRHWMETVQDWCISRQLWWGHRIPAYYKGDDIYVGTSPPEGYVQDEDVLDTWFSSALWPFSTLGWPDQTDDFKRYYPTQAMVTGYDIIFFWVARMIFSGLEFTGQTPFEHVMIHGLIRDDRGRKMSKSLGNGIDPMDVKEQYGMDTLRYFLTTNSAPGQDLRFEHEKVASSWNYLNKIWNIARFILMNVETHGVAKAIHETCLELDDRWIIQRFNETVKEVSRLYETFEFGEAAKRLNRFIWDDFASWYIEIAKITFTHADAALKQNKMALMLALFRDYLKLMHPFVPFITEAIYEKMPNQDAESIMISPWPWPYAFADQTAQDDFDVIKTVVQKIRNIRSEHDVAPKKPLDIHIAADETVRSLLKRHETLIGALAFTKTLHMAETMTLNEECATAVLPRCTVYIPLGHLVDLKEELARQEEEKRRLENEIARAEGMLANQEFIEKAPAEKVDSERRKRSSYSAQHQTVLRRIEELKRHV